MSGRIDERMAADAPLEEICHVVARAVNARGGVDNLRGRVEPTRCALAYSGYSGRGPLGSNHLYRIRTRLNVVQQIEGGQMRQQHALCAGQNPPNVLATVADCGQGRGSVAECCPLSAP